MTMMNLAATSRRAVRTLAHRVEVDWSRPVFSCSPDVAAKFNKLKGWVAMSESMAEKYKAPPAPVDFGAAKKSVRDKQLVAALEAFYKASSPPSETFEMPAEEIQATEENLAYLKELDALNKEFAPILEKEIDFTKNTRTSADTTIFDMKINYPLMHEEIEDELERREWFKDTGIGGSGSK